MQYNAETYSKFAVGGQLRSFGNLIPHFLTKRNSLCIGDMQQAVGKFLCRPDHAVKSSARVTENSLAKNTHHHPDSNSVLDMMS